jgi:hypothetical protein
MGVQVRPVTIKPNVTHIVGCCKGATDVPLFIMPLPGAGVGGFVIVPVQSAAEHGY